MVSCLISLAISKGSQKIKSIFGIGEGFGMTFCLVGIEENPFRIYCEIRVLLTGKIAIKFFFQDIAYFIVFEGAVRKNFASPISYSTGNEVGCLFGDAIIFAIGTIERTDFVKIIEGDQLQPIIITIAGFYLECVEYIRITSSIVKLFRKEGFTGFRMEFF